MINDTFAEIKWTRQDIRDLLDEKGFDSTEKSIDEFLEKIDIRCFIESCIQDGWERLYSIEKNK